MLQVALNTTAKHLNAEVLLFCRQYVLHHIPYLRFLDSRRVGQSELIEARRRGQFMKVIRPKATEERGSTANTPPPTYPFTPLPKNMRAPDDQRGK